MDAKTRQLVYLVAAAFVVICGGCVVFGLVSADDAKAGVAVIAVGLTTILGMAAKNARD